jgi:rhamnose utilization protein RhaD (predicted bifunctional aldolase and dehydrogenase)
MRSRWDDVAAKNLDGLDLLVYASRLIGTENSLVVGRREYVHQARRTRLPRARTRSARQGLRLDLKSIEKKHFPGVRMDDILALLERKDMGDQEMVDYLAHALQEPASPRPSIEHVLPRLPARRGGDHTHADAIVSLTNNDRAAEVLREVYRGDVIALQYRRPGFLISREVAETFERHPKAKALLLEKHGTICWGATVKDAYLSTIELISRAEEAIEHRAKGRARFGGVAVAVASPEDRRRVALAVAPALRGLVGRDRRVVLAFDDAPDVLEFACRKRRRRSRRSAPRLQTTLSTPSVCPASLVWTIRASPRPLRRESRRPWNASSPSTPATSIPTIPAAQR